MITKLLTRHFKCFREEVVADFAPLTLLYGENSAGKSALLQSLLIYQHARHSSTNGWGPIGVTHGPTKSDAKTLFYASDSSAPICVSICTRLGATEYSFGFELEVDGGDLTVNKYTPTPWLSLYGARNGSACRLELDFSRHPDIEAIYQEFHSRRQDISQGYQRCREAVLLNKYLSVHTDAREAVLEVCAKCDLSRYQLHPFPFGHLCEDRVEQADRFVAGLPAWIEFAAPGWAAVREAALQAEDSPMQQDIDFYSREFTFAEFLRRNSHGSLSLKLSNPFQCERAVWYVNVRRAQLPKLVQDIVMASDPNVSFTYSWMDVETLESAYEYYLAGSSHAWKNKPLAETLGLGPDKFSRVVTNSFEDDLTGEVHSVCEMRRQCCKYVLAHLIHTALPVAGEEVSTLHIDWLGPFRHLPAHEYAHLAANLPSSFAPQSDPPDWLEPRTRAKLNEWLSRLDVGYEVDQRLQRTESGVASEVVLRDTRSREELFVNWAEAGFGFSQLFPIIAAMESRRPSIIAIQQPELHIHPRLQAELGSLFTEAVQLHGHQVLIETHSEHLMLRIQKLIRKGDLKADNVSVLYVSRGADGSSVQRLRLDTDGEFLDPWPNGFFPERAAEILGS